MKSQKARARRDVGRARIARGIHRRPKKGGQVFNFGVEIGVLALQRQIADYQIPSKVAAADLEIRVPGIRPMNPHPARDQEYRGSNHDCRTRVQPCHPFGFPYLRASGRSGRPVSPGMLAEQVCAGAQPYLCNARSTDTATLQDRLAKGYSRHGPERASPPDRYGLGGAGSLPNSARHCRFRHSPVATQTVDHLRFWTAASKGWRTGSACWPTREPWSSRTVAWSRSPTTPAGRRSPP
jgi:hypothetical protein